MEIPEGRLIKIFNMLLSKGQCPEPLNMACRLIDRLKEEIEIADSEVRIDATDEPIDFDRDIRDRWDASKPKPKPVLVKTGNEDIRAGAPPAGEKGRIIMPDDPEFAVAEKMTEKDRRAALAGQGVRISRVAAPTGAVGPAIEYWTYEGVIEKIQKNCPKEIWFTPNGYGPETKFRATLNWEAKLGMGFVQLKYNAGTSDGHQEGRSADPFSGSSRVVIGLEATYDFPLSIQDLDFADAERVILMKLKGLYHKRDETLSPTEPALPFGDLLTAPKWNANMAGMKDEAAYTMPSDRSIVANPQADVLGDLTRENKSWGNK